MASNGTPEAWYRELNDGRVEIGCKGADCRLSVTASKEKAWEAVELFEEWTGMRVESERRPRRKPREFAGQLSMTELQSGGSDNG